MQPHAGGDRADTERWRRYSDREAVERDELEHRPLRRREVGHLLVERPCGRLGVDAFLRRDQIVLVDELAAADSRRRPQLLRAPATLASDDITSDPKQPRHRL